MGTERRTSEREEEAAEGSTMLAMGVFNDKMAFRRVGSGNVRGGGGGSGGDGGSPEELERTVRKMKLFEHMTPSQLKAAVASMEHIVLQVRVCGSNLRLG